MSEAAIALNRFGLGARPDQPSPDDPRRWLAAQIERYRPAPPPIAAAPTSAAISRDLAAYQAEQRTIRQTMNGQAAGDGQTTGDTAPRDARMAARQEARRAAQDRYVALVGAAAIGGGAGR